MQTPLPLALSLKGRRNKTETGLRIASYASSLSDPELIRTEDVADDRIRFHPCWPQIDIVTVRIDGAA